MGKRRPALSIIAALVCILYLPTLQSLGATRPDLVLFLTDDPGQLDSTAYGGQGLRTPNMQRLADVGMTFTRAYVASPSCAPSRAALLTGLMPARNGAEANHSKPRAELKKWSVHFKELGYEVVAFCKVSHYKHTADYGFDHFSDDGFHQHAAITNAIAWPKARPRTAAMVQWIDLLPTLIEAAEGKAPTEIDGRSFLPVLRGQSAVHRDRIFTTHANDNRFNVYPARAVRDEQRNLAADPQHATKLAALRADLDAWMKT